MKSFIVCTFSRYLHRAEKLTVPQLVKKSLSYATVFITT